MSVRQNERLGRPASAASVFIASIQAWAFGPNGCCGPPVFSPLMMVASFCASVDGMPLLIRAAREAGGVAFQRRRWDQERIFPLTDGEQRVPWCASGHGLHATLQRVAQLTTDNEPVVSIADGLGPHLSEGIHCRDEPVLPARPVNSGVGRPRPAPPSTSP